MNSDTMHDPIAELDRLLNRDIDIWETAIAIGQSTEEEMSIRRWILGDVAIRVDTKYGENSISKYAAAINVNSSTLKQRRQMSAFYPKDTRVAFSTLGYSHYRAALKLGDIDRALWALEKAEKRNWPVFKFEQLLNRLTGKRRNSDTIQGEIHGYGDFDGYSTITIKVNKDDVQQLLHMNRVTIRPK